MNNIINKSLLVGDKFMPDRERIKKFRETDDLKHIYKNVLD